MHFKLVLVLGLGESTAYCFASTPVSPIPYITSTRPTNLKIDSNLGGRVLP